MFSKYCFSKFSAHFSQGIMGKIERTCEANTANENSSVIFVKSVPPYHFELAYVAAVK